MDLSQLSALTPLDLLFLASAATLLLALLLGRWRIAGPLLAIGYGVQFWLLLETGTLLGEPMTADLSLRILGQQLGWRYDALSWFFAMISIGAGFVAAWYAGGSWQRVYQANGHSLRSFHVALAMNVFTMLLLVGSGDFLSLFIGWELVSWSSFLLMVIAGGVAAQAAAWGRIRLGRHWSRGALLTIALGVATSVLSGAVVRESLRLSRVDVGALATLHQEAAGSAGMVGFLLSAALVTGVAAWCLTATRRALRGQSSVQASAQPEAGDGDGAE